MTDSLNLFIVNADFSKSPDFLADWDNFSSFCLEKSTLAENFTPPIHLEHYINGKNLACPMPLLKLKMALKNTQLGNVVYLTATDPNSTHDIGAFCRHLGYPFTSLATGDNEKIFHILVQKSGWIFIFLYRLYFNFRTYAFLSFRSLWACRRVRKRYGSTGSPRTFLYFLRKS